MMVDLQKKKAYKIIKYFFKKTRVFYKNAKIIFWSRFLLH